jgi:hypothetical protein
VSCVFPLRVTSGCWLGLAPRSSSTLVAAWTWQENPVEAHEWNQVHRPSSWIEFLSAPIHSPLSGSPFWSFSFHGAWLPQCSGGVRGRRKIGRREMVATSYGHLPFHATHRYISPPWPSLLRALTIRIRQHVLFSSSPLRFLSSSPVFMYSELKSSIPSCFVGSRI